MSQNTNKYFNSNIITNIKLYDITNQDVLNGMSLTNSLLNYQFCRFFFKQSTFPTRIDNKIIFVPFCSDPQNALFHGVLSGSMNLDHDFKLKFTPSSNGSGQYLNVIFLTVAMAEVFKNQFNIILS